MENKYQQWRTRSRVAGKLPFGMILALMTGDNSIPAVDAPAAMADKRTLDEARMSDRNGSKKGIPLNCCSVHLGNMADEKIRSHVRPTGQPFATLTGWNARSRSGNRS